MTTNPDVWCAFFLCPNNFYIGDEDFEALGDRGLLTGHRGEYCSWRCYDNGHDELYLQYYRDRMSQRIK